MFALIYVLKVDDNKDVEETEILLERITESNYQKEEKRENVKLEKLPQRSTNSAQPTALGSKPEEKSYDPTVFHGHLVKCLELGKFEPFPTLNRKQVKRTRSAVIVRHIYWIPGHIPD